jgi:hypothetical protein
VCLSSVHRMAGVRSGTRTDDGKAQAGTLPRSFDECAAQMEAVQLPLAAFTVGEDFPGELLSILSICSSDVFQNIFVNLSVRLNRFVWFDFLRCNTQRRGTRIIRRKCQDCTELFREPCLLRIYPKKITEPFYYP